MTAGRAHAPLKPREHRCPSGCGRMVTSKLYACPDCWIQLPPDIQAAIAASYPGKPATSPERRQAVSAAGKFWRRGWNNTAGNMTQPNPIHQPPVDRALDLVSEAMLTHPEGTPLGWVIAGGFLADLIDGENARRRAASRVHRGYDPGQLDPSSARVRVLGLPVLELVEDDADTRVVAVPA